jgi:pyrroline-5-carboxylate reductase
MLKQKKIAIIGTGNLGSSIAGGLLKQGFPTSNIYLTDKVENLLITFKEKGIHTGSDNKYAIENSDIIIVAIKPYNAIDVFNEISSYLKDGQMLVSVVSGIPLDKITECLQGKNITICRAMPNTAIAINESMTCIAAPTASEDQKNMLSQLFNSLGISIFLNEDLMDASTVLAACGIAFAMRFIRAMIQGGIEIGFDSKTARLIANQTVKGAAELLIQKGMHPEEEIDKVTTPKGYTISGLNEMEHNGFSSSLIKGILTSFQKINK